MSNEILWRPDAGRVAAAQLSSFVAKYIPGADYRALHAWSVAKPGEFWEALWEFASVIGERDGPAFAAAQDLRKCEFFPDSWLNYAENLLRGDDVRTAVVFVGENGTRRELTMGGLKANVAALRGALAAAGVVRGDRVVGSVANTPETLAAMLATLSIGAIWSSCSPDFGPAAVEDRFGQIAPKILFGTDGYFFKGKLIDCRADLAQSAARLPGLVKVVLLPYALGGDGARGIGKGTTLAEFVSGHAGEPLEFTRIPFREPGFILFSSGTTGKPKCITHSGGGMLLKHLSELLLHCDVRAAEKIFYHSTCGWMMWNWHVSALAAGATLVLYDGNPMHPGPARLADLVQQESVAHFGTSAKFLDACAKAGLAPAKSHDISSLRAVYSTGSPLAHESYDYVYRDWKSDLHLASISGGTDICACFLGGVPVAPVRRGELQAAELGCDMAVFDEEGGELVGEPGELVCRNAIPSMPVKFWGDADGSCYRDAYFAEFPGVWRHGDWVLQTPEGGFSIIGRSDTTLNPGGVRIGTAEIYRRVERFEEVLEALAIGQEWEGDQRVILFVRMREGQELTDELAASIRAALRNEASPRHVPASIHAVSDLPRTRSGKIAELAVRNVIHGLPVRNEAALANPESLELFKKFGLARIPAKAHDSNM